MAGASHRHAKINKPHFISLLAQKIHHKYKTNPQILTPWSGTGGEAPLPTMTISPALVTSSIVTKMNPGPGGKTLLFGGLVTVRVLPSFERVASMNTRRWLECQAWEEKPRSMRATVEC